MTKSVSNLVKRTILKINTQYFASSEYVSNLVKRTILKIEVARAMYNIRSVT